MGTARDSAKPVQLISDAHSSLWELGSLKILKLSGTPVEREHRHGELIGSALSPSVLDYFSNKFLEPFSSLPRIAGVPLKRAFLSWLESLLRSVPAPLREEVHALAAAARMSEDQITAAICLPDLGTLSNSWQLNPAMAWARMRFGCTTLSGRNAHEDFVLARNLDFPGVGHFDTHPLVVVHLPSDKDELKRISIAADGVHFGSISAINECGIGLVVHQNYTRINTPRSVPLMLIGDWILRKARTLEQAVELLRLHRPGPMWTFVFFDLRLGKTAAIEASKDHFNVRLHTADTNKDKGFFQANHCLAEKSLSEQFISTGTYINSCRRLELASSLTENCENPDDLVSTFAQVLAGRSTSFLPDLTVYDDIIKPITIQSMIFEHAAGTPHLGRMFISCDPAPTPSGRYVEFDLDDLFSSGVNKAPEAAIRELVSISGEEREYQKRLAQASRLSFDERNDEEALQLLSPHQSPGSLFTRSVLAYRLKQPQLAAELASQALKQDVPLYVRQSLQWVVTLSHLAMGDEIGARKLAAQLLEQKPGNEMIAKAASRLTSGARLRAFELNLIFDFFAGDLISPPQVSH